MIALFKMLVVIELLYSILFFAIGLIDHPSTFTPLCYIFALTDFISSSFACISGLIWVKPPCDLVDKLPSVIPISCFLILQRGLSCCENNVLPPTSHA